MEGINVLLGIDAKDHLIFVKVTGQGELTEDTVNFFVCIELVNKCVKLFLSGGCGKLICLGIEANLLAGATLVANINLRCGIVSNDYNCKSGSEAVLSGKLLGLCLSGLK